MTTTVLGPAPSDGAVVHSCSSDADFDGLRRDQLLAIEALTPVAKQEPQISSINDPVIIEIRIWS